MRIRIKCLWAILLAAACGGAEVDTSASGRPTPSVHRAGDARPFVFREAMVAPGGLRDATRRGTLRTLSVESDGSARLELTFETREMRLNGRVVPLEGEAPVLRFISAPGGGVAGSMSLVGPPTGGEGVVAATLPLGWPPVDEWPTATSAEQEVAVSMGGSDGLLTYRLETGAPAGVEWLALGGTLSMAMLAPQDRRLQESEPAELRALFARTDPRSIATRLRLSFPNRAEDAVEVELMLGEGVPLPDAAGSSLLSCIEPVRALRARFGEAPLPPFVLNRVLAEELRAETSEQAEGPGVFVDLRASAQGAALATLFEGLPEQLADRDVAALSARLDRRIDAVRSAMRLTAQLTGLREATDQVPIYILLDPTASAARAVNLGVAVRRGGRDARLVVRRVVPGSRADAAADALASIAARLAQRGAACPFLARALDGVKDREVVVSPGWVRAVVAGGVGTCGCDPTVTEALAADALAWSDVSKQSWGYVPMPEATERATTVADLVRRAGR